MTRSIASKTYFAADNAVVEKTEKAVCLPLVKDFCNYRLSMYPKEPRVADTGAKELLARINQT